MKTRPLSYTVRLPETSCPTCGHTFSAASAVTCNHDPRPGDATVCIECAQILVFEEDFNLHKVTPAELLDLQLSQMWPEIERTRRAIQAVNAFNNRAKPPN